MKIVFFWAGGQAKETIDLIEDNTKAKIVGIINRQTSQGKIFGYKILGTDDDLNSIIRKSKATHFFIAIGDVKIRGKLYSHAGSKLKPVSIISKKAHISKYAKIGEHVILYPGVIINADVTIGNNVLINSNVSIGHETKIGNNVNINPGVNIAGKVMIGQGCTIGIGASIREQIILATNTYVGAGAVVVKNTKPNRTYIGIPAKI